ncbi:MAG: MOSC domain-containing protein [bacterium]|nr:MAG: MOSC domain-containing protein [bacterium]
MARAYLKQIVIYPVKSAAGILLMNSKVSHYGLQYDRCWMLIDENNRFLSARKLHKLVLIQSQISETTLTLLAPGMSDFLLPLSDFWGPRLRVQIWNDECTAVYCGKEAQDWFSSFLGNSARLVFMPGDFKRRVDPTYTEGPKSISFTDGYPFLLISEASLADLNTRIGTRLEMARFRPNLVVEGCRSYEEDSWKIIRIGGIRFKIVKSCSRCVITTLDPKTAKAGKEPLRTLAGYRSNQGKVYFGQNLIHMEEGQISAGMPVEVLD